MPNHCALIGDIKGSRKLGNWPEVFSKLQETLSAVNRRFADDILIPFKPTVGDEFQGALKSPRNAYDIYTFIKASLPVDIYCGIGVGEVEKTVEGDAGLRGTAFYRARSALEICKGRKGNLSLKSADEESRSDLIINTLLRFIETIENSWTRRQNELVRYYRLFPHSTYEQVGKHFGISASAAYQILKATNIETISEGELVLKNLIQSFDVPTTT